MALAFIGPRPEGLQVLHSDDVPTNNNISNLRYGTPKQNAEDRELNGNTQKGVKHFKTSLTDVEVLFARFIYADPAEPTVKDIAHSLGVNRSTAQDVISGRTWHHLKQYPYNRMKGRQPYKLTQDNLKQAIEMKEAGIPVKVIANHFHCSEDTIYRRIKQFKNENTTTTHT